MASKLELLLKKKNQLEAQIKLEQNRDSARKRKLDTKLKILIGAYYKKKHEDNETWDELVQLMDDFLVHKSDRAAFDLAPKIEDPQNQLPAHQHADVA